MARYNRTSFSAYLEDCDYKGYKTYIWIENMTIRYFFYKQRRILQRLLMLLQIYMITLITNKGAEGTRKI